MKIVIYISSEVKGAGSILIGRYYRTKHGKSIDDGLILELVMALDGETFLADSVSRGIEYFAADVTHESQGLTAAYSNH